VNPTAVRVPGGLEVLVPFVEARVFGPTEVHLAATVARLEPGTAPEVLLGLAVAARGPRLGHVCIDLHEVSRLVVDQDDDVVRDLPWPEPASWAVALSDSAVVASPDGAEVEPLRPLVWDGRRLYLQRYFHYETAVARELAARARRPAVAGPGLDSALDALFGPEHPGPVMPVAADGGPEVAEVGADLQRRAAALALTHHLAVIAGGPGTGKTRTIARMLAAARRLAAEDGTHLEVALVAPTGKAAARMGEAVRAEVDAAEAAGAVSAEVAEALRATGSTTVHALLGWAPGTRFRHDRQNPLSHDLVIVDETSMVSLPLMARLLDALRPDASLVLVGDPNQLASVEAGTVMSDIVGPEQVHDSGHDADSEPDADADSGAPTRHVPDRAPLSGRATVLRRVRRFAADSAIAALGEAVRVGDADRALQILDGSRADAVWIRDTDLTGLASLSELVVATAVEVVRAAQRGDAPAGLVAATRVKVLAATRHRPFGLYDWSDRIEAGVRAEIPELDRSRRWYPGRPIIVTRNDRVTRVSNGDVGLVVRRPAGLAVALSVGGGEVRMVPTSRLDQVETWWAMTIHKSQGSEFPHAVVSLPEADSPILSRELLYTAVTRAKERVTIVGSEAVLRAAIGSPISRASGLSERLWGTRNG